MNRFFSQQVPKADWHWLQVLIRCDVAWVFGMKRRLLVDTVGASALEYGLVAALIGVATMGAVFLLGDTVMMSFYMILVAWGENLSPEVEDQLVAFGWERFGGGDGVMTYEEWLPVYDGFCDDCEPPEDEFANFDADFSGDYSYDEWDAYATAW